MGQILLFLETHALSAFEFHVAGGWQGSTLERHSAASTKLFWSCVQICHWPRVWKASPCQAAQLGAIWFQVNWTCAWNGKGCESFGIATVALLHTQTTWYIPIHFNLILFNVEVFCKMLSMSGIALAFLLCNCMFHIVSSCINALTMEKHGKSWKS